jgi:transposase
MGPLVRRTWAPCGKTPILYQRTRSHEKVSVIAAISVSPKRNRLGLYFSLHYSNITSKLVMRFLKHLSMHIQKPVVLVWDCLLAHRAKIIQRFFLKRKRFHLYFFPPYAPELNPVEQLWGYLKLNPMANLPVYERNNLAYITRYNAAKIKAKKSLLRSFLYATPLFSHPK